MIRSPRPAAREKFPAPPPSPTRPPVGARHPTEAAGPHTIFQQGKGTRATPAGALPAGTKAVRVQRVGPNLFNVQRAGDCGGTGGWTTVANGVAGPVTVSPTQPSADHSDILQVCY